MLSGDLPVDHDGGEVLVTAAGFLLLFQRRQRGGDGGQILVGGGEHQPGVLGNGVGGEIPGRRGALPKQEGPFHVHDELQAGGAQHVHYLLRRHALGLAQQQRFLEPFDGDSQGEVGKQFAHGGPGGGVHLFQPLGVGGGPGGDDVGDGTASRSIGASDVDAELAGARGRQGADDRGVHVAGHGVGELGGVYVGGADASRRRSVANVVAPWAAANPERLKEVDTAAGAAVGKLLANLALAVTIEGFKEALLLGESQGLTEERVVDMLGSTGLEFIVNMKSPFLLGERSTSPGDFTADAIAKDARLMLASTDKDLPAVSAALASLEQQQEHGHGDEDFSTVVVNR